MSRARERTLPGGIRIDLHLGRWRVMDPDGQRWKWLDDYQLADDEAREKSDAIMRERQTKPGRKPSARRAA